MILFHTNICIHIINARPQAVLSVVAAAIGQSGQQINEPGTSRSLKSLPGSCSDLALACLIHVGR